MVVALSLIVMAISIASAYFARENYYSSMALLILRSGYDYALRFLIDDMKYSHKKSIRTLQIAMKKHQIGAAVDGGEGLNPK